jgi:di/tricarboxylate transporter
MRYSQEDWAVKRAKGLPWFLMFDGILMTGGPFAVVMQVVGYFLFGDQYSSFGQYFSASKTWITFFFHATVFGLIMGFINWRRNERAFAEDGGNQKP